MMFTGLVEAVGHIAAVEDHGRDRRLRLEPGPELMRDLAPGDSIAVDGACLTAVDPDATGFHVDVSAETLAHTTLGQRDSGDRVNLERALLPTTRLGGHLVSGHVDAVAAVADRRADGSSERFRVRLPERLTRYVAPRGSVCVDGISLTVTEVEGREFAVNIVPHTLTHTTLGDRDIGDVVNIEVDLIARYLERLLDAGEAGSGVTRELLQRSGFMPE